jgi:hypothetical protein
VEAAVALQALVAQNAQAVPVVAPCAPKALERERAARQEAHLVSAQVPPAAAFFLAAQQALWGRVRAVALALARQTSARALPAAVRLSAVAR